MGYRNRENFYVLEGKYSGENKFLIIDSAIPTAPWITTFIGTQSGILSKLQVFVRITEIPVFCAEEICHHTINGYRVSGKEQTFRKFSLSKRVYPERWVTILRAQTAKDSISYCQDGFVTDVGIFINIHQWTVITVKAPPAPIIEENVAVYPAWIADGPKMVLKCEGDTSTRMVFHNGNVD